MEIKEVTSLAEWSWKRFGYAVVFIAIIGFFLFMTWEDKKFQQRRTVKLEELTAQNIAMSSAIEVRVERNTRRIYVNESDIKRLENGLFEVRVRLKQLED